MLKNKKREMSACIKTGITAWTEKTLVASGWYPKDARTAEARLRYYASQFPVVETDSTYYAIPARHQAELWSARTTPGFTMDVKAFASFTRHYTDPRRLPADVRDALPTTVREKHRVYPKDLGDELMRELADRFRDALEPLRASGKLGVVLFQFPVWFPASPDSTRTLVSLRGLFPDYRIAVEFRNATWLSDKNRNRTLSMLRDHGLLYTSVDEPQGFPSSVPPIAAATGDIAVVRFHGRARDTWSRTTESARERFAYRYSTEELREWVPRVQKLARETEEVHVLMNNCYSDYAVVNARELEALFAPDATGATCGVFPDAVSVRL